MASKNLPATRDTKPVPPDSKLGFLLHRAQHELSTQEAARQEGLQVNLQRNPELRQHHRYGR